MSDRRKTPMNDRVCSQMIGDMAEGRKIVRGAARQVIVPVADLLRAPGGARDRQLLMGEQVQVFEEHGGFAYLQAEKDGYCGYVASGALGGVAEPTHWVCALATHVYLAPDFKRQDVMSLSFGSRVAVRGETDRFFETTLGFIPRVHLQAVDDLMSDPVDVASRFIGTPYLWGGNSRLGIDCSGLVQAALLACGVECAGDSDLQEASFSQDAIGPAKRGDVMFWKGHVGLIAGNDLLLHANAHHMATAYEPLGAAIARIEAQGDGPVTRHVRF